MEREAKSVRILITDSHELAGLGALRSIGRAGYHVVAGYPTDAGRPASVWSRYCSDAVRYPDPWKYQTRFQEWLLDETERETYDFVLPVSEAALFGAAVLRDRLPRRTTAVLPSNAALAFSLSKYRATRKAMEIGIPCPSTAFVSDGVSGMKTEELEGLRFPIVIKTDNHLRMDGSYEKGRTRKVLSLTEARRVIDDLEGKGTSIIAQEYIPGSGAGSFLLRYKDVTCLAFAHRRIHEVPYSGGWSSLRESIVDRELLNSGETLLKAIDFQGLAMVEFRRSQADGRPYFLEINGRLWGSIALALHCGVDFPRSLIDCWVLDKPIAPSSRYPVGVKCRNVFPGELGHVISVLKAKLAWPTKAKTVADFVALSLNPAVHHDHFWMSDPLPGLAQAVKVISETASLAAEKILGKLRRCAEKISFQRMSSFHRRRIQSPATMLRRSSRVMFVCYGNICRSPFAQAYWNARLRRLDRPGPWAVSSGFLERVNRRSPSQIRDIALSFDVDLSPHLSRSLDADTLAGADIVFVMDLRNLRDFLLKFPGAKEKVHLLAWYGTDGLEEIADPYGASDEQVRECFAQISACIDALMAHHLAKD